MFGFVLGTPKDDVLKGSPEAEYIGGFGGNDILDGGGGGDVLVGSYGADHFVFSQSLDWGFSKEKEVTPVDTILDFKSEERDRIDLSHLNPDAPHGLTFSENTPGPYSVYYQPGCSLYADPMMKSALSSYCHNNNAITLMADLDGNPEQADFMVNLTEITAIKGSDLILG